VQHPFKCIAPVIVPSGTSAIVPATLRYLPCWRTPIQPVIFFEVRIPNISKDSIYYRPFLLVSATLSELWLRDPFGGKEAATPAADGAGRGRPPMQHINNFETAT